MFTKEIVRSRTLLSFLGNPFVSLWPTRGCPVLWSANKGMRALNSPLTSRLRFRFATVQIRVPTGTSEDHSIFESHLQGKTGCLATNGAWWNSDQTGQHSTEDIYYIA